MQRPKQAIHIFPTQEMQFSAKNADLGCARGVAAGTWAKASVALKRPSPEEVEVMQEAADSLHGTGEWPCAWLSSME